MVSVLEKRQDVKRNKNKISYVSVVVISAIVCIIMFVLFRYIFPSNNELENEGMDVADTNVVEDEDEAIWSEAKEVRLNDFVNILGQEANKQYIGYDNENSVRLYGYDLPEDILSGEYTPAVNREPVTVEWSEDGEGTSDYEIVAAYSNGEDENEVVMYCYLFTIHNGEPTVLYTGQTEGNIENYLYFYEPSNEALKEGFKSIVNNEPLNYEVSNNSSANTEEVENNSDSYTDEDLSSNYSALEIEYARVWLETMGYDDLEDESFRLQATIHPAGTPIDPYDKGSATFPVETTFLGGYPREGIVYSSNFNGTITVYPVPSHWQMPAEIASDPEEIHSMTQEILEDAYDVSIPTGNPEIVRELIERIEME